jgi:hypothetical protein
MGGSSTVVVFWKRELKQAEISRGKLWNMTHTRRFISWEFGDIRSKQHAFTNLHELGGLFSKKKIHSSLCLSSWFDDFWCYMADFRWMDGIQTVNEMQNINWRYLILLSR